MKYLIFKATNTKTKEEIQYLYNEAPTTEREAKAWTNYAKGIIERDLNTGKSSGKNYNITVDIVSYREIGTHLEDYKFIEPPRTRGDSNVLAYKTPSYPLLDKIGCQGQGAKWLLSGLSKGEYNKA